MIRQVNNGENTTNPDPLGGHECDWPTLTCLAGQVLTAAALAVMAHAEAETSARLEELEEQGRDA